MSDPRPPHVVEDCRGILRVFSDGSIFRSPDSIIPFPIISIPDEIAAAVDWTDLLFDPDHNLHLRLYTPRGRDPSTLPLLIYFHGGGFCIGSRTWPIFHACCLRLAASLPALVAAPDYRLAPEHPLPAAIHDAAAAVHFIAGDFENPAFLFGESAGGNIAHHLAVRFGSCPIRFRGHVLLMPAFAGTQRTRSELESPADAFLTLELNDRYWRLALPPGATPDHPLVNPAVADGPGLEEVEVGPMMVVVGGCDLLRDREVEYTRRMVEWGKEVELVEFPGQQHGFFCVDPWSEAADELVRVVGRFVREKMQ